MVIELKSNAAIAKIDTKGAELISFVDVLGTEYIWQKDAKYWGRSSPVLFPIVGNLRAGKTIIAGKEYQLEKHGFCRDAEFHVSFQSESTAVFTYSANEETLRQYPYRFCLSLAYRLEEDKLNIRYTVMNMDDKPIDYCLGAHPAFCLPEGEFEEYFLDFEQPENTALPVYDFEKSEINIANRVSYLKNETRLPLKYSYFDNDALIFDTLKSRSVRLQSIRTGRGVQVDFNGFESLAFWTPIGLKAPFLCIEPWCGMAVCSDEGDEYEKKRGIQHLEVDGQKEYSLSIRPL